MPVILIRLPEANIQTNHRPRECPHCSSQIMQRWGRVTKPVRDKQDITAVIYRYRCLDCKRTFRDYPDNIDRASHTREMRRLAAVLWTLGLSYREIIKILNKYEINLSLTTIWRESQALAGQLAGKKIKKLRQEFRIDKHYIHNLSNSFGLVLAVDLGGDEYVILGTLDEHNPVSVKAWLEPLVENTRIEISQYGTDSLNYIHTPY